MEKDLQNIVLKGDFWKKICLYEELDSTNLEAKRYLAENEEADGVILICEQQTQGRGRRGRTWVSQAGDGIWMSLVLQPQIPLEKAPMMTILAGMAVRSAIQKCYGLKPQIKWPNDIIINGKKVCGILTEMRGQGVIVGIGINVGIEAFAGELEAIGTSIAMETGMHKPDRKLLVEAVLQEFEEVYQTFKVTLDLSQLKDAYNQNCINIGRQVRVIGVNEEYMAVAEGMDEEGELIVVTPEGTRNHVSSGEVTIRGVMGYAR